MKAKCIHRCTHVLDKEATIAFYQKALGMHITREVGPADGSWSNTYMACEDDAFEIELTWNRGRTEPYENGGLDAHLAFEVADFEAAHALHKEMGCIQKENPAMGLYFILDPDGQRIEILPVKDNATK